MYIPKPIVLKRVFTHVTFRIDPLETEFHLRYTERPSSSGTRLIGRITGLCVIHSRYLDLNAVLYVKSSELEFACIHK